MKDIKRYKIFYSFQSENIEAKRTINKALSKAKKALENTDKPIQICIGADGFPGMADIPLAIEYNIANCDLFIADLTPTSITEGRANPNSNVIYELGKASFALGYGRMIGVALTDSGTDPWESKDLPFDFNKNRIKLSKVSGDLNLLPAIEIGIDFIRHPEKYPIEDVKGKREEELERKRHHPVDASSFFAIRMAQAFPGIRGLLTITDEAEIRMHLDALLAYPVYFARQGDERGDTDPLWLWRAGEGDPITGYRYLGNRHYLIGSNEFNIRALTVFKDSGAYYKEYVLIEADADEPTGFYEPPKPPVYYPYDGRGYTWEEYGIFTDDNGMELMLTREEYDDGAAIRDGKIINTHGSEIRTRFTSPVNYLLTAKWSSFNNRTFCRTSQEYMDGLLQGRITREQLHEYLMAFPKPQFH